MRNVFKRSGEKGIGLFREHLFRARITLTILYTIILAIILFLSSGITYSFFSNRLEYRFNRFHLPAHLILIEERFVPPRIEQVRQDLFHVSFAVNSLLLVGASILSYWLAGITLKPIQTSYDRQRRFLSDASHELRTPLAILQTNLENEIGNTHLSEHVHAQAKNHLEEVERMSRLVRDLLTLSRLDEDVVLKKDLQSVNIISSIEQAIIRLEPIAKRSLVNLYFSNHPPTIFILANPDLLLQVLSNVIKNGIIYNKKQGRVDIEVKQKGSRVEVVITDTGVGIDPLEQEKIFERFYRVDKSRSRQSGGSGLGLSIVKSIMDQFGGSISLKSTKDKGTQVCLIFRIHKAS